MGSKITNKNHRRTYSRIPQTHDFVRGISRVSILSFSPLISTLIPDSLSDQGLN